jgi:PBP4 family serine-type D-alanyl-D-alanine carboxypeptidase
MNSIAWRSLSVILALSGMTRCEPAKTDSGKTPVLASPTLVPTLAPKSLDAIGVPPIPNVPLLPYVAWKTAPSHQLDSILRLHWERSKIKGRLGISVYSTRYGRTEASLHDSEWFTPASNLKLIVTAAVIDTFPINHFPVTSLDVRGKIIGRTLHGNLIAIGGGDPNVSSRFFPNALSPLKPLADSLRRLGIDSIQGWVTTVDTFFRGPRRPTAWRSHHFNTWYGAEITSLSYQDNAFDLTVSPAATPGAAPIVSVDPDVGYVLVVNKARTAKGKGRRLFVNQDKDTTRITLTGTMGLKAEPLHMVLPVRNPPAYFRAALLRSLTLDSIAFQSILTSNPSDTLPLLHRFSLTTAPLYDMVEEVNQKSQNLQAESLLRHLGGYVNHDASDTAGIRAEYHFLHKIGVDTAAFQLKDGCGLSAENRITPHGIASLLAAMVRHPYVSDYIGSLATPGLDGATGRRLRPWYQSNMIRYKTGSINRVQSLSGYAFGIDGDTLAVALFVNDFSGSPEKAARLLDSLFVGIANWANAEREAVISAHKLMSQPEAPPQYRDRLRWFSAALEGRPYFLGPTGEGRYASPENKPILDMSRFDCVTYIESVMGLALSRSARDVLPMVKRLRYRGDTLAYTTRNHYFVADWLANNAHYVRVRPIPGDTVVKRTINKVQFFTSKKLPAPAVDPTLDLRYLPYEKALELSQNWTLGSGIFGVAFVTEIAGLDVTHTGFLLSDGKAPVQLRHASQLMGHVATMNFTEYLATRKGKCSGIVVFEFLDP